MTKIYFIDGKKVDLDSSEWNLIYNDGMWSDEGISLYFRKKDDSFILESWSNWQGVGSNIKTMTRKEAINYLIKSESDTHPQRVNEAFETIKYFPQVF